jgi:hypothetical protein
MGLLRLNFPIPDRFQITKMSEYVKYKPGLSVDRKASFIFGVVNKNIVFQSPLVKEIIPGSIESIKFDIPVDKLYDGYNEILVSILQNGEQSLASGKERSSIERDNNFMLEGEGEIKECRKYQGEGKGGGGTKIWSQVYTEDSYIEFDFKLKPFEEKISSIYKFMFDNKNPLKNKINFVFPEVPTEEDFNNYGLMANIIGYFMKFKYVDFRVSTDIDHNYNNILIMQRDKVVELYKKYCSDGHCKDFNLTTLKENKLAGNINLLRIKEAKAKGVLVITGENQLEIETAIRRLVEDDVKSIQNQNLYVSINEKPKKVKPFSAPQFVDFDKKIYFSNKSLFEKENCSDSYVSIIKSKFKLYPVVDFSSECFINKNGKFLEAVIKYFALNNQDLELVFNVYINGIFAHQFYQQEKSQIISKVTSEETKFSPALLQYGENSISIEVVKYTKNLTSNGLKALQTTLLDDSYFKIPKVKSEVKLPNLKYISDLAFPFSIYPDLQDTAILITDFNADTIASAMQVAFHLGARINYPGYHLQTTYDINKVLDKNIIVLGNHLEKYAPLYKYSPIKLITGDTLMKEVYNPDDNTTKASVEIGDFRDYLFVQTYQSPFDPQKIILDIASENPQTLLKGVEDGFLPKNRGNFEGDVWIYDTKTEKSHSHKYGKEYILDEIVDGFKNVYEEEETFKDIEEF